MDENKMRGVYERAKQAAVSAAGELVKEKRDELTRLSAELGRVGDEIATTRAQDPSVVRFHELIAQRDQLAAQVKSLEKELSEVEAVAEKAASGEPVETYYGGACGI